MSVVPKLVQWLNEIPSESQQDCFVDTRQFRWKGKESRIAKIILKQQNKAGKVSLPGLKNYFRDSGADRELNTQSTGIG